MKTNKDVIYRNIAGEHVLIPVGRAIQESSGLFVMTELGARIWEFLDEGITYEEMIKALLDEYDVEESELRADVDEYIQKLKSGNLIN